MISLAFAGLMILHILSHHLAYIRIMDRSFLGMIA